VVNYVEEGRFKEKEERVLNINSNTNENSQIIKNPIFAEIRTGREYTRGNNSRGRGKEIFKDLVRGERSRGRGRGGGRP
jgi:hypothetical protein